MLTVPLVSTETATIPMQREPWPFAPEPREIKRRNFNAEYGFAMFHENEQHRGRRIAKALRAAGYAHRWSVTQARKVLLFERIIDQVTRLAEGDELALAARELVDVTRDRDAVLRAAKLDVQDGQADTRAERKAARDVKRAGVV